MRKIDREKENEYKLFASSIVQVGSSIFIRIILHIRDV